MITIQIDDFDTSHTTVAAFESFMSQVSLGSILGSVEVSAYALLSVSDRNIISRLKAEYNMVIGIHGWNHFWEPLYGYWQARHLLEVATSWQCFDKSFVMPWNKGPCYGFLKALRESEFTFVSPYKLQCAIAELVGCSARCVSPDYLLHPPDLLLGSKLLDSVLDAIGDR